jgi:hypothetical protein
MDVRTKSQRDVARLLHQRNAVGIPDAFDFAIRTFQRELAAIDGLLVIPVAQMKPGQLRRRLATGFDHVFCEPKNPVNRPHHGLVFDKGSLALDPHDPPFGFQFVKRLARRRVAHLIFFDDLILRRHQRTGGQLACLDHADDFMADLKIFWRTMFVGVHAVSPPLRESPQALSSRVRPPGSALI